LETGKEIIVLMPQVPQNLSAGKIPPALHAKHFVLVAGLVGPSTNFVPCLGQNLFAKDA
jgi:hypothetical protein